MKRVLLLFSVFLSATTSYALTVFGETSAEAKVDYSTANDAECSVVALGELSAVYLGNGWFITAEHCKPTVNGTITQNGAKGYIDSVVSSINGVDLSLFHVSDLSSFSSLKAAKFSTEVFSELSAIRFSSSGKPSTFWGYSELLLVGNGKSGDANVETDSNGYATISATNTYAMRSGTAPVVNKSLGLVTSGHSATGYIITASENVDGTACVQEGDSGGGMFFQYENDWYLVGILGGIIGPTSASKSSTFGNLTKSNTTISQSGNSNISLSCGINLQEHWDEIEAIVIPEPAETATMFAVLLFAVAVYLKRGKR